MSSIKIDNVSKSYGKIRAVREVNLTIQENCLFGLIGPDGAGKTTLFRLITSLLIPDNGSIAVFGNDVVKDYRNIRLFTGYMPGRFSLYADLTVAENLSFYATIFGTTVKANYDLIKPVYCFLEPFHDRLSKNLSGGMKQKLALCCALIHNPRLLVLDEPTTGVDAVSRKEFWESLHVLKGNGMTILVSTPYMDEAEKCDKVALMQDGRIMEVDAPNVILSAFNTPLFEVRVSDRLKTLQILRLHREIKGAYLFGQCIHVSSVDAAHGSEWIRTQLVSGGIIDAHIDSVKPDFEDCFIDLVEHENLKSNYE